LGKLTRYTTPPALSVKATTAQSSITAKLTKLDDDLTHIYTSDEAILSTIRTKKERRKQEGIIKFAHGSIDPRKVAVKEPWDGLKQNDDDDSDGDEADVEGMDADGEDGDGDEDGDEDEEQNDDEDEQNDDEEEANNAEMEDSQEGEEEAEDADEDEDESEVLRISQKQKRKRGPEKFVPLPPAKKVAFSALPPVGGNRNKIEATMKGKKQPMKTAQQQQILLKPVQVSSSAATKSLSKPSPPIPVHKTSEKKGKVANITAKTKGKGGYVPAGKSKDKGEPEVYDFGKFF